MSLLQQLPVRPGFITENVVEAYVKERDALTTPSELAAFVKRWQALYRMTEGKIIDRKGPDAQRVRVSHNNLVRLIGGKYDPIVAFQCLKDSTGGTAGHCKHAKQYGCAGMHVALPLALAIATHHSHEYGVSSDLALIQANGGLGALEGYDGEPRQEEETGAQLPEG